MKSIIIILLIEIYNSLGIKYIHKYLIWISGIYLA